MRWVLRALSLSMQVISFILERELKVMETTLKEIARPVMGGGGGGQNHEQFSDIKHWKKERQVGEKPIKVNKAW